MVAMVGVAGLTWTTARVFSVAEVVETCKKGITSSFAILSCLDLHFQSLPVAHPEQFE